MFSFQIPPTAIVKCSLLIAAAAIVAAPNFAAAGDPAILCEDRLQLISGLDGGMAGHAHRSHVARVETFATAGMTADNVAGFDGPLTNSRNIASADAPSVVNARVGGSLARAHIRPQSQSDLQSRLSQMCHSVLAARRRDRGEHPAIPIHPSTTSARRPNPPADD